MTADIRKISQDFFQLSQKTFLITGVANKKSLAYSVVEKLLHLGATPILSVQNQELKERVEKLFPNLTILICDVEKDEDVRDIASYFSEQKIKLDGLLHSLAYARFENPPKPFHEVSFEDFIQATKISCHSFISLSNSLKNFFYPSASCVTISISDTKATAYGYLGPIKAMLDATVPFLAHSFASFSSIRFNAVAARPLKTSASAGIPNYLENYLYSEQLTLRKKGLATEEVVNTILFLLSPLSSGINGQKITIDAGLSCNFFDQEIVKTVVSHI